jgi:ribulose-phosphate 3-epimerase
MTAGFASSGKPIHLGASIACANLARLEEDLEQLCAGGIDSLHIDMMDGRFVSNFGLDFTLMETIRRVCAVPMDCHLMIEDPERYIDRAATAGAEFISIHFEATRHAQKALRQIRDTGAKSGIALNPATPIECLEYILDDIDFVTVMTVNPGAAGQRLIPAMLRKIADVRRMLDASGHAEVDVQVDGNVSFTHIPAMVEAGATMLVGGTSSVFHKDSSIPEAIATVRQLVTRIGQVS